MQIQRTWQDIQYQDAIEVPKIEIQTFKDPVVTNIKAPILSE